MRGGLLIFAEVGCAFVAVAIILEAASLHRDVTALFSNLSWLMAARAAAAQTLWSFDDHIFSMVSNFLSWGPRFRAKLVLYTATHTISVMKLAFFSQLVRVLSRKAMYRMVGAHLAVLAAAFYGVAVGGKKLDNISYSVDAILWTWYALAWFRWGRVKRRSKFVALHARWACAFGVAMMGVGSMYFVNALI